MNRDDLIPFVILGLMFVILGLIVGLVGSVSFLAIRTSGRCLAAGYPEFRITFSERYCIKHVNQTDVVMTLEQAEAGR